MRIQFLKPILVFGLLELANTEYDSNDFFFSIHNFSCRQQDILLCLNFLMLKVLVWMLKH